MLFSAPIVETRFAEMKRHVDFSAEDASLLAGFRATAAHVLDGLDACVTTKTHGTGLGLSITRRIVTDHGGSIDLETRPGRTLFRVILPVAGPRASPQQR